jgi:hypothetical protein
LPVCSPELRSSRDKRVLEAAAIDTAEADAGVDQQGYRESDGVEE